VAPATIVQQIVSAPPSDGLLISPQLAAEAHCGST
jgi:hypothetical protein